MNINAMQHLRVFLFANEKTKAAEDKLAKKVASYAVRIRQCGGLLEWRSDIGFVLHTNLGPDCLCSLHQILVRSGLSDLKGIGFIAEVDPPTSIKPLWDGEFAEGECLSKLVAFCAANMRS